MAQTEAEGFTAFVDAELPRLLGYAHVLTGNEHDAWDLTQEALARVGLRWSRIDADGNPGAYARTTLVRLNIDRLRRLRWELPRGWLPEVIVEDRYAVDAAPWLVAGLAGLTPRQRTAVVLRFVDDLDMAGIAAEMNCSLGTAKSHLSRGLQRLRDSAASSPIVDTSTEGSDPHGRR
jgi:RNA polymerase sigma-70 factor (sigma-E family)